ncbi:MBL fold metallo-hydrolase [uncultured Pantoea sp.]|uniref:MBL fold metallo-hydrolase n=1 Tax=uncultured Pantoea sp. TaxID=218084 RepID=UPI002588FDBA|nr:MBL fold metallo-hydrolase [uncultured Pantoea sp.]
MSQAIFSYTTGKYQVSAISDGTMQASLSLLTDIHHDDAVELQRQAGIAQPGDIHVFCYLIRGQGRVILVDTGMGKRDAQSGKLLPHLELAGVTPDDIDTLLLTHAHPDHIGGLLDSAGQPVFRHARLCLSHSEAAFWQDDAAISQLSERAQLNAALVRRTLQAYGPRLQLMADEEISPGIRALALPGHTPGHCGFRIDSDGERLLIWGDIVHYPPVQLACPQVSIAFDIDPVMARESRQRILQQVAAENTVIAGMHFGASGFARIVALANGGYTASYVSASHDGEAGEP